MRILLVAPRYYPHVGGVEYVVKSVAERLARRGHEVTVLCGEDGAGEPVEEHLNGVRVVRWPVWSPSGAYHVPRAWGKLRERLLEYARGCDVVHLHSVHSVLTMYSLELLKRSDARKVLTPYYHGTGHTLVRKALWIGWRHYVKRLMQFVNAVHTVSRLEAQLVERDFGIEAIPIENGVDEWVLDMRWSPSGYAMYSGRIEKYKNIHRLANVVKILNKDYGLDLELRIYGSGTYLRNLRRHLERTGVRYSISPSQPFEKYIETLSRASLFGLLSERESYPQSVNEANAIGVPVVVAEPWGLNFSGRSRTLVVRLDSSDELIAREVSLFLDEAGRQPRPEVPGWSQVVNMYVRTLYGGS